MAFPSEAIVLSRMLDEHRHYLGDRARVAAYGRALAAVVRPGAVVLDLGAGTGILGLLACRAGAARVYAIDEGRVIELAREIARANGLDGRVVFVEGLSTRVDLPERVDVVVGDIVWPLGVDAGLFEYFADARERFLKPGGVTVPRRITLEAAPVEVPETWGRLEAWHGIVPGFDFAPARRLAVSTGYPVRLEAGHLLGGPGRLATVDPSTPPREGLSLESSTAVARAGLLHGVGTWFRAELAEGVCVSTSPLAAGRIDRFNVFFPIERPVAVEAGDRVRIRLRLLPAARVVTWTVDVGSKASFTHSTWHGALLSLEALRRTRPDFKPTLSAWGEAWRSVVSLCDGRRTLSDVEREVLGRHPGLFRSPDRAVGFVAHVLARVSA